MKLFLILIFVTNLFSKEIIEYGEATALDLTEAKIKARNNAKKLASDSLKVKVDSSFKQTKTLKNNDFSSKTTISKTFQKSNSIVELLEILSEDVTSQVAQGFGIIYKVKVKVKYKVTQAKEKSKKKIKQKPLTITKSKKEIKQKASIIKKQTLKPININNLNISLIYNGENNFFQKLNRYILIIPNNEFHKIKWEKRFSKNSNFYKKISKYLYKFNNYKLSKNLKPNSYKTTIVLGDEFYLVKQSFEDLNIKNKQISKSYQIFDKDFRLY